MATKRQKIGAYVSKLWSSIEGILVEGIVEAEGGIITKVFTAALVDGAPTAASLVTLLGTAASKGAGYSCIVIDSAGTELRYHVYSDGADWIYSVGVVSS